MIDPPNVRDRLTSALSGRYSIERELGEGGMATVYLAEDLKHHREVAIKVLKPELAAVLGAERFVAEITTTAQLQHPNILPLFDSGEADRFLYYVMPYVEGESLRDKLDREKQLGIDEAVKIATEVADALEYAHRHGVVHRDIKPENILLHAGRPVVADFGIALAVSAAAGGRMTETGLSLGTPHYMSPEQATAEKDITGRSDTYSLGAVLYEMLTGDPPHTGKTAQQIIAKIVTEPPSPVEKLRKSVPPNVAAAVATSLEKLPADRFDSAKAFAEALANPSFRPGASRAAGTAGGERGVPRAAFGAVSTAAVVFLAAALWGWLRPQPPAPLVRYRLGLPDNAAWLPSTSAPTPAPDGSFLVYGGLDASGNGTRLWLKRRDSDTPTPIPGTDGAENFSISPDGAWIAFTGSTSGTLQRVPVSGGAPVTVAQGDVAQGAGLAWLNADTLVVPDAGGTSLETIPVTGGPPHVVYHADSARVFQPAVLPGGRGVLFGRCYSYCAIAEVWALDLRSGEAHAILSGVSGSSAYLAPGYVAYDTRAGGLFAIPFDRVRLQVHGTPIPIADSLPGGYNVASRPFHVSRSGTLVIQHEPAGSQADEELVWVDPQGRVTPVDTSWTFELTRSAGNVGWSLSPDGKRLAIGLHTSTGDAIWVKHLPLGAAQPITNDSVPAYRPRWIRDGSYVTFVGGNRHPGFFTHRADGVGADSLLVGGFFDEGLIAPGGTRYVLRTGHVGSGVGGRRIMDFRPGADSVPVPLISAGEGHDAEAATVSPDGRWIAYVSNETRPVQVFVQPYPEVSAGKWQVSRSGGADPLWSRDGSRLFYVRDDGTMMSVRVTAGASPPIGDPAAMFRLPAGLFGPNDVNYTPWDVAPDGRFIMVRTVAAARVAPTIVVVENWLQHWERSLDR